MSLCEMLKGECANLRFSIFFKWLQAAKSFHFHLRDANKTIFLRIKKLFYI